MPTPKSDLENLFFDEIKKETPERIAENQLINLKNDDYFTVTIKKEHLEPYSETNPEGLGLREWFHNYEQEAQFSTGGIRGPQNILFPWDTRYPISYFAVLLATYAKAKVALEEYPNQELHKLAASEVRYNSSQYVKLIARVQAALDIKTHVTPNQQTIPVWMASFLIFVLDLYGGEFVTSSHGISKKTATKDLNNQGSQFIPEETALFIEEIRKILNQVESYGSFTIQLSAADHPAIDKKLMAKLELGVPLYVDYLKSVVANEKNLGLIRESKSKILVDSMGGCMYRPVRSINQALKIDHSFEYLHPEEDPFFHQIGKVLTGENQVSDICCDVTQMQADFNSGEVTLPLLNTMGYEKLVINYPVNTMILVTDPDGDRLALCEIESEDREPILRKYGIAHTHVGNGRVVTLYPPNQAFLMTFNFHHQSLKEAGVWSNYDWFMIKTSASSSAWDDWAKANRIPIINTPVGFKEVATVLQKIEVQLFNHPGQNIVIQDIFGQNIDLGTKPRLLFAGEESGGQIFGPIEPIVSRNGRKALAMREKSAGEAIIITSALSADLDNKGISLSDYLVQIYEENDIESRFDARAVKQYYDENNPSITKLQAERKAGMEIRNLNDTYFLSLAFAVETQTINLDQARKILTEALPEISFDQLTAIQFVGDGTFFRFTNAVAEVRPSGTDAINKAYCTSPDFHDSYRYAQALVGYNGTRNPLHQELIPEEIYQNAKQKSLELLKSYQRMDSLPSSYLPPNDYRFLQQ